APFPIDPKTIDAVVLTHAHLDHSGYLPKLVKEGFGRKIIASHASMQLSEIIRLDSGHLQEKDAEYANRRGCSKHKPALPLYGIHDAE
ncbi:MBL fold metallo-hydrolase, partial [Klebsiella pneumoniae]